MSFVKKYRSSRKLNKFHGQWQVMLLINLSIHHDMTKMLLTPALGQSRSWHSNLVGWECRGVTCICTNDAECCIARCVSGVSTHLQSQHGICPEQMIALTDKVCLYEVWYLSHLLPLCSWPVIGHGICSVSLNFFCIFLRKSYLLYSGQPCLAPYLYALDIESSTVTSALNTRL